MPMPEPEEGEDKEEFIDRCMADEIMNDEYPDEGQRYAVCESLWDDSEENNMNMKADAAIVKTEHLINKEIRTFELDSLEVRASDDGESKKINGHAAVFDKKSEDLGGFREVIEPGAFSSAIKKDDVRALFNHDPNYILGRNKAGTLELEEDDKGLYFEIEPPDTSYARDLMVSIERKDISQCSFAFSIDGKKGERWEVDGEEVKDIWAAFDAMFDSEKHEIIRYVVKARLYDVSPVTYPAYPQTDVKARSLEYKESIEASDADSGQDEAGARDGAEASLERMNPSTKLRMKQELDLLEIE